MLSGLTQLNLSYVFNLNPLIFEYFLIDSVCFAIKQMVFDCFPIAIWPVSHLLFLFKLLSVGCF